MIKLLVSDVDSTLLNCESISLRDITLPFSKTLPNKRLRFALPLERIYPDLQKIPTVRCEELLC